ncbi:MAG: PilZ domain-containing protein [Proteobacteria bacterium]|nr:PilZ domain-containing protein [Pseudomonadota bacterium]MBU1686079.1 PilZ domain-containing protein [Pseudomonadota bacterium]
MKAIKEEYQKIFVDQEGGGVIKCPSCSKSTLVDSSVLREKALLDHCMVRCTCHTRFAVKFEFRKDFRKNSKLTGEYVSLPKGKIRGGMKVVNISPKGIGLKIDDSAQFKIGDELLLLFTLDDTSDSLIEKRAIIRFIKQNYIGCEFLGSFPIGKALGVYLESEADQDDQRSPTEKDHFDWPTNFIR